MPANTATTPRRGYKRPRHSPRERDACLTLADGYTKLAELLEHFQAWWNQKGLPKRG